MADITANGAQPAAYRPGEHPDLPPPLLVAGPVAWLKRNFFSSIGNTILTFLAVVLLYLILPGLINWAVIQANFGGGLGATRVVELKVIESTAGLTEPAPAATSSGGFDFGLTNVLIPGNVPGAAIGKIELVNLPSQRQTTFNLSDSRFEIRSGELKLRTGVALDPANEPSVTLAIDANAASGTIVPSRAPAGSWSPIDSASSSMASIQAVSAGGSI